MELLIFAIAPAAVILAVIAAGKWEMPSKEWPAFARTYPSPQRFVDLDWQPGQTVLLCTSGIPRNKQLVQPPMHTYNNCVAVCMTQEGINMRPSWPYKAGGEITVPWPSIKRFFTWKNAGVEFMCFETKELNGCLIFPPDLVKSSKKFATYDGYNLHIAGQIFQADELCR